MGKSVYVAVLLALGLAGVGGVFAGEIEKKSLAASLHDELLFSELSNSSPKNDQRSYGRRGWMLDSTLSTRGYKRIYSYNSQGVMINDVTFGWSDALGGWDTFPSIRFDYQIDSLGNALSTRSESWDLDKGGWHPQFRYSYEFTEAGLLKTTLAEYCSTLDGTWSLYSKSTVSQRDSTGKSKIVTKYVSNNDEWLVSSKIDYDFDATGNMTTCINRRWISDNGIWGVPNSRREVGYDLSVSVSDIVGGEHLAGQRCKSKPLTQKDYVWDTTNDMWVQVGTTTFCYTKQQPTPLKSGNPLLTSSLLVSRQLNTVTIVAETAGVRVVDLYSATGRLIRTSSFVGTGTVTLGDLSAGLYVLSIVTQGRPMERFRFIKY